MGAFTYQALDAEGRRVKGVIEADSERQARSQLRSRALKPVAIQPAWGGTGAAAAIRAGWRSLLQPRIPSRDVALLTRQLATLIQAGMPLDEALNAAAQQSRKPRVKALLLQVRSRIVEGHTLAYALGGFPRTFGDLYRAMVRAGESAGFLGNVMEQLADYTENSQQARQKLQMAMIYPLILVLVALAVVALLMVFVVPKLVAVFAHSSRELPALTEGLIALSHFFIHYLWALLLGLAIAAWGVRWLLRKPAWRRRWHRGLLKVPLLSQLLTAMDAASFAQTLGMLVASGVPLLEGLRIAGEVVANTELRAASREVALSVQEGGSLQRALAQTGLFPPMMVHMVASGEVSGELQAMLARCAANQKRELEMTLGGLMAILEPVMVVVMAVVVGVIVLAILLPIIQMNSFVR